MADNTTLDAGTGGDVIASDDIGGVKYPRVKVTFGADGSSTDVASGAPLPVILAANSGVDVGDVTVNNASLAVTNGGTFAVQVDNTVTVASHAVTNAGTFAVQVTSLPASTNTIEVVGDAAHDAAVAGNPVRLGAYAKAAAPTDVSADGDTVNLWADLAGRMAVWDGGLNLSIDDGGNTITVDGTVAVTGVATAANQTTIIGHVDGIEALLTTIDADTSNLSVVGGGTEAAAIRVTLASDSTGVLSVDDNGGALTVDGTVTANLAAGTNNIGDVDILSIAAGDNNIGNVDVASLPATPAGTNAIGKLLPPDVDVTTHTNYAKKYYTSAGAATDGIVWSPAAGKRWHVVSMYINVSAAATVTLEDDKAGGDEAVWKAEFAANSGTTITFSEKYPLASGEDAADLIITTTAGNVYVTVTGYEV